jgi:hypothetical protein
MSTQLIMTIDVNGNNTFGLGFAEDSYDTELTTGVAQSVTVPDNFKIWEAVFAFENGANVWVANNETATIPGGAFALTPSQLNPTSRRVKAGDVLSFITSDTSAQVNVSFYYR